MPWESIGDVDTQDDGAWLQFARRFALKYIEYVCGNPPEGCTLGSMDTDHDLGSYSTIGICYEYDYPQDYIRKAEESLEVFNSSVDLYRLRKHAEEAELLEAEE